MKLIVVVVILVLASAISAPAEIAYEVKDLGDLGGGYSFSTAVNQLGMVGGYSYDETDRTWGFASNGDISPVSMPNSQVFDLNDEGMAVGLAVNHHSEVHAFAWKGQKTFDLGTFGGSFSYALGVCGDWIVGGASDRNGIYSTVRPVLWILKERKKGPPIQRMICLSSVAGWASDVNRHGQVCITLAKSSSYWAFRWHKNHLTLLGSGYATGINNAGKICGYDTETGISRAKIWKSDGIEVVLPPLVPDCDCWANRINNKGIIVGTATDEIGYSYAVRWDADGTIHDLNDEINDSENIHFAAMDNNDSGDIVTRAWSRKTGLTRSFLLTPK